MYILSLTIIDTNIKEKIPSNAQRQFFIVREKETANLLQLLKKFVKKGRKIKQKNYLPIIHFIPLPSFHFKMKKASECLLFIFVMLDILCYLYLQSLDQLYIFVPDDI